jgi:hypothetical protein
MGFRLADPAYEAAVMRGEAPSLHPVSQAKKFPSQRMLLVAPTLGTPRDWKSQGQATDVCSVETCLTGYDLDAAHQWGKRSRFDK